MHACVCVRVILVLLSLWVPEVLTRMVKQGQFRNYADHKETYYFRLRG